jgi:hypothetical protein
MTEAVIAWLAGYLEGEGCFRLAIGGVRPGSRRTLRPTGTPTIKVAATDQDVVAKAASLMGCVAREAKRPTHAGRTVFTAEVHGERALALMRQLLPHMGERRSKKIREALSLAAQRPGHAKGSEYRNAKLSDDAVREMRRLAGGGARQIELARQFGISQTQVSLVVRNERWRHIAGTTVNTLVGT